MRNFLLLLLMTATLSNAQTIQFRVDTREANITLKKLGIRGNGAPLSWEKSIPLTDEDKDGIFETTITLNPESAGFFEYKYIINDAAWELPGENRIWFAGRGLNVLENWNQMEPVSVEDLPLLQPATLLKDLALLRAAMDLHPAPLRYLTASDTAKLFADLENTFSKPCNYREAYLAISAWAAAIRCGHTFASYFNQNGFIQQTLFNQRDKVPFHFTWIENRMIVTDPVFANNGLLRGDEVLNIHGVSAKEILEKMKPFIKADGNNNAKRINDLQLTGYDSYESFDIYFPMLFPPVNGAYGMQVKRKDSLFSIQVSAVSRNERVQKANAQNVLFDNPAGWKFTQINDSVALLKLSTFATFTMEFEWEKYLANTFKNIRQKNIKHLLIDIRGNEGGDDNIPFAIAKEVAIKTLLSEPEETRVGYEKIPENLAAYCNSWTNDYKDFSGKVKPLPDGSFTFKKQQRPLQIPANPNAYTGSIYLLINAANSSATYYMARFMRYNKRGLLVGETTGGDVKGINGGQIIFFRLPGSGIEVDIPVYGNYYSSKGSGGIVPDIEAISTIQSFQQGIDVAVKAALNHLENKR